VIETERLVLRAWRDDDREPFADLNADAEVMEFVGPLDRAASDELFDRVVADFESRGWGVWVVEQGGRFIGFVGLTPAEFASPWLSDVEISWRLSRAAWGRGLALEAARAALAYGFDRLELPTVVSYASETNFRARALMERLGMDRDPDGDFAHPNLPASDPHRAHVLYRAVP
jgi:RimJ/RimL family protein N-acetyltransferase